MSRQKLTAAVGLLTGHTTLTALMIKLGPTKRQDGRLCGDEEEDIANIVRLRPALTCKGYRTLGLMILMPKDLENMRMNGLVASTRLGLIT
jgi:hypothetical protein